MRWISILKDIVGVASNQARTLVLQASMWAPVGPPCGIRTQGYFLLLSKLLGRNINDCMRISSAPVNQNSETMLGDNPNLAPSSVMDDIILVKVASMGAATCQMLLSIKLVLDMST